MIIDLIRSLSADRLLEWLEQYRSWGAAPGLLLPFLKSFVPPLPTIVIVGWNAAVYGLWLGFLYSWIGMVAGCLVSFAAVRAIADRAFVTRWSERPKIARTMHWIRTNGFVCVLLLSLLPGGPFVVVNTAAGLARMRYGSFVPAVLLGKGIMVFAVSALGHDPYRYVEQPWRLVFVLLLVAGSVLLGRAIEASFAKRVAPRKPEVLEA